MIMSVEIKVVLDLKPALDILQAHGLEPGGKVQHYIATQLVGMFDGYVPLRSGFLKGSASANLAQPYEEIVYSGPYAARMYYNPQFNFNGAPQRGAYWDKRAWADHSDTFLANLQNYVDRGGGSG